MDGPLILLFVLSMAKKLIYCCVFMVSDITTSKFSKFEVLLLVFLTSVMYYL